MLAAEILDALAHDRFHSLINRGSELELRYVGPSTMQDNVITSGELLLMSDSALGRLIQRWVDLVHQWESEGNDADC